MAELVYRGFRNNFGIKNYPDNNIVNIKYSLPLKKYLPIITTKFHESKDASTNKFKKLINLTGRIIIKKIENDIAFNKTNNIRGVRNNNILITNKKNGKAIIFNNQKNKL